MKLLLIAPASSRWRGIGRNRIFNGRTFRFTLQSLLSVAAATPREHTVKIVDEQVDEIPWQTDCDLVGITCMTAAAPRAYEIAQAFRVRGIPVVLGGMHPSLCSEEARQYADAVVVGEAEAVWPRVLQDAQERRLSPVYRAIAPCDLGQLAPLPCHLLKPGAYARVHAVQASRGCRNHCRFCSVAAFSGSRQRYRPVARVIEELRAAPESRLIFIDDNLTADRDYARELFRAMIPLRKSWVTQCTLDLADDPNLVRLAAQAGCTGIFVGMETFGGQNLECMEKHFNRIEGYAGAVRRLHEHGIGVEAGIVVGLPHDGVNVFQDTLHALETMQVDAVQVSCCTPLPGTPLYEELRDRIVDRDWSDYDFHHAVFLPQGMATAELQQGHDWLTREFYQPWRIARRIARLMSARRTWRIVPFAAVLNLAYLGRVLRWGIRGSNPAALRCKRQDDNPVRLQLRNV